jgi:hypothetical protein
VLHDLLGFAVVLVSLRFVGERHDHRMYYYQRLYKDGFGAPETLNAQLPVAKIVLKP